MWYEVVDRSHEPTGRALYLNVAASRLTITYHVGKFLRELDWLPEHGSWFVRLSKSKKTVTVMLHDEGDGVKRYCSFKRLEGLS